MTDEDSSCHWCHRRVTDAARARSRWLGLAAEDVWACADCVASGRYRVPPDGWAAPEDGWLARDQYVLDGDDVRAIVCALNEVLHGPDAVEEWEFRSRLGVDRTRALRTLQQIAGRSHA